MTRRIHVSLMLAIAICCFGCGSHDTKSFLAHVRTSCCKNESRTNPLPMQRNEMIDLLGEPARIEQVSATRQEWVYVFEDGEARIPIAPQQGSSFDAEDPRLFVDLVRLAKRDGGNRR